MQVFSQIFRIYRISYYFSEIFHTIFLLNFPVTEGWFLTGSTEITGKMMENVCDSDQF